MRAEQPLSVLAVFAMLAVICAPAAAQEAQLPRTPSLAFLEFLGAMVEVDDELLGPEDMVDMALDPGPVPEDATSDQDWGEWESGKLPDGQARGETEKPT